MATQDSIVSGLFTTPEQYQQQQLQTVLANRMAEAKLSPEERANYFLGAGIDRAAQGVGGLMGVQDPAMKLMAARQQVLQGLDPNDPASMTKAAQALAQAGDQQGAMQLAQRALEIRNVESQISGRTEEKQAQRALQKQIADERNATQLEAVRLQTEAKIEAAAKAGATQKEIAQMRIEGQQQLAQIAASMRAEKVQVADDKAATRIGQNTVFDTLISEGDKLTAVIDANKDAFSLGGRASTAIKSVMNPSAPSVQAVSDVDSYLKKARNAYLLAAKGTQTEGDAQRAWEEFAGKLDFSSAEGAKRSVERIKTELATQKQSNEAYLKSRGISSGAALGTKENPIKLK